MGPVNLLHTSMLRSKIFPMSSCNFRFSSLSQCSLRAWRNRECHPPRKARCALRSATPVVAWSTPNWAHWTTAAPPWASVSIPPCPLRASCEWSIFWTNLSPCVGWLVSARLAPKQKRKICRNILLRLRLTIPIRCYKWRPKDLLQEATVFFFCFPHIFCSSVIRYWVTIDYTSFKLSLCCE